MRADDQASLATRRHKDHGLTPARLAGRWQTEADQVDLAVGLGSGSPGVLAGVAACPAHLGGAGRRAGRPGDGPVCSVGSGSPTPMWSSSCAPSPAGVCRARRSSALADRFLASELAVRLTPDAEAGRRRPAEWSTAAHRALEDRTVALVEAFAGRPGPAVDPAAVDATLADAGGLGDDQAEAVRVLTGAGGSVRAVLAPAGYGKTTMLRARSGRGRRGRPVMAVATTAKAVAELCPGAGLDARTIARLRIDLGDGPLAAGTVVVLDEISQSPTGEVEAVLAAVDACPGGSLWVLGDPRQSQPVGAGGIADHLDRLATDGLIPAARLTVNRRQVDVADREALEVLRRGDPARSQQLRAEHGWEHEHPSPGKTREAMADAVCARHRPLRSRPGGGPGRVPWRRRGPGRSRPGPPGRHRRAHRCGHDGPGMEQRP